MAIKDIFKVSRKTFFNPSGWLDIPGLSHLTGCIIGCVKRILVVPSTDKTESFEQALTRLKLSKRHVLHIEKNYFIYALCFLALGIIAFGCSLDFLVNRFNLHSFFLAFAVSCLFLIQAFKYHFLHFLIKQKKLGLTFDDWVNHYFSSGKKL